MTARRIFTNNVMVMMVRAIREQPAKAVTDKADRNHRVGTVPLAPDAAAILAIQGSAGNAAVTHMLVQRQVVAPAARAELHRGDQGSDVELLQLKLNHHLGFMRRTLLLVDGRFGPLTAGAVRAFKREHHLRPASDTVTDATWQELDTSPHVLGERAAHQGAGPEYDRMLADGLLEVTLTIGFDEHGIMPHELQQVVRGLTEVRGFNLDPTRAAALRATAGRPVAAPGGDAFVRENYGASHGQPVHCVLSLISPAANQGTSGATARAAALAGMNTSDVFMYGGHARYGTGPDFDVDYVVTVHWDRFSPPRRDEAGNQHTGDQEFDDAEEIAAALGISNGVAGVAAFTRMEAAGQVEFRGSSGGNIGINPGPMAERGTLGAFLIGRSEATAPRPLETAITEQHYRLWMFNGCTTRTYVDAIRGSAGANPSLGTRELDMIVTDQATQLRYYAETLLSTLDGLMANESATALDRREEQATPDETNTHSGEGFAENP